MSRSDFKADFRPSADHPDHWEIWHSRDDGETWTFDRLEAKRVEPSDEQLEHLTLTLGLPTLPPSMRPPDWRAGMLNLHAIVQKAVNGDDDANMKLAHLRSIFSERKPHE